MNNGERYEYKGQLVTKADIAKISGHPWYIVDQRIKYGWSIDKIINTPVKKIKKLNLQKNKDECENKTESECLNCLRSRCIYDEVSNGRKQRKKI